MLLYDESYVPPLLLLESLDGGQLLANGSPLKVDNKEGVRG